MRGERHVRGADELGRRQGYLNFAETQRDVAVFWTEQA